MYNDFPLWPERASTIAGQVDALFIALIVVTGTVSLLVWLLIIYFGIKYRRRPDNELAQDYEPPQILEIGWIVLPTIIFIGIFLWGAWLFFQEQRVPANALDVYATARQWMWKFEHAGGQRELNTLHVPIGRPIRITMASEDVIHSLWFPAFRVKMDVLPSRYRTMWFQATKTGRFHIFCAEYCGMNHSGMIGSIIVMQPSEFDNWLSGNAAQQSPAVAGQQLFQSLGCVSCHGANGEGGRGPALAGLFGRQVFLTNGQTVIADEAYVRESIENPQAKLVSGFGPIMPTFQGQVTPEQLIQIMSFIKSLQITNQPSTSTPPAGVAAPPVPAATATPAPNRQ